MEIRDSTDSDENDEDNDGDDIEEEEFEIIHLSDDSDFNMEVVMKTEMVTDQEDNSSK